MEINLHLFALILAVLLFSKALGTGDEEPRTARDAKIRLISLSDERLEMIYYKSSREAVRIVCELQGRSRGKSVHLSVTTLDNRVVFSVDKPSDSAALWSFEGSEFLFVNETQPTSYFVPPQYSKQLKNAMKRKNRLRSSLLNLLDHENVNETSSGKIDEFLMHPDVNLLIEAAKALGNQGVYGRDNQPAMIFYSMALRFSKTIQERNENTDDSGDDDQVSIPTERRSKRWWSPCSNGHYCLVCPIGRHCVGLCGDGCNCWWWVCGNCCYNFGCYAHDQICGIRNRHDTFECWATFPLGGFGCTGPLVG